MILYELEHLIGQDHKDLKASDFSSLVIGLLKRGKIRKEVLVLDRGDGRKGRIDIIYDIDGVKVGIELDRFTPRKKSIFKLKNIRIDEGYVITRAPFKITKIL